MPVGTSCVGLRVFSLIKAGALQVLRGAGSEDGYRSQIFVGCDNAPVTFEDMVKACIDSGAFEGSVQFTGTDPASGKRMYNRRTKDQLGWEPKYSSFVDFMHSCKAKDWYASRV
jgi:nucleoside-diphosphate-sugar epimerase